MTPIETLELHLRRAIALSLALRQAHWNVKGRHFYALHKLFGKQYEIVDSFVDEIAERLVQLGQNASGAIAKNDQYPANVTEASQHLMAIGGEARSIIDALRNQTEDVLREDLVSGDLLIRYRAALEKLRWMMLASV